MKKKSEKISRQILKGARKVFSSKGFAKTTMADIAKASGVSPATIYNYYDGKQFLFDALNLDDNYRAYQPEREQKRADIIRAALLMFGEKGYKATTLEAIMRKVNMGKTTIYQYFDSKEELFAAVVAASQVNFTAYSQQVSTNFADWEQFICNLGQAYLDMGTDPTREAVFKTVMQQSTSQPEIGKLHHRNGIAAVTGETAQYLQPFKDKGILRKDIDLRLAMTLFQLMVWGYTIKFKYIKGVDPEFSEDEVLRHAVSIFFDGIRVK